MEVNRHEKRRKRRGYGQEEERGEEREVWHNRWYILPGGSQGRGEGGSAIRQHTQEEVGKTLAVSIEIRRKGRQKRRAESEEG